ncbi:hypothetical protein CTEN210_14972 [Chaetoceros tenuissimus]|uniref:Reverse transcriptase Ty1/copia-type domain-containing protein n=1 Tax=Chaetoceros tenuissimus TaxID=426638 RepID=A0AAD3D5Z4_9STRA|nr:hypothetical protein CTEN210_14972 [Chaetoceros tenuissimus]
MTLPSGIYQLMAPHAHQTRSINIKKEEFTNLVDALYAFLDLVLDPSTYKSCLLAGVISEYMKPSRDTSERITHVARLTKLLGQIVEVSSMAFKRRRTMLKKQRKLTRKVLQELDTWEEWEAQEFKQLDDYDAQDTFGPPQDPPPGANLLSLLWVYLVKDDGRKKARCVCNGAKNRRGSVTLAETYASALEQHASQVFWASTAVNNWTAIGADATNAFAEAGARLHLYTYTVISNFGTGTIVVKDYKGTGKSVLFLKQVDDFTISCETKDIAEDVIASIDSKMSIKVKKLGLISRFNGVDVLQTRDYIKIYNKTYIEKFCAHHPWLHDMNSADFGIPMRSDNTYIRKLEEADPLSDNDRAKLEKSLGFTYRQIIGEVIYALTTCRLDINFDAIKLSQYSATPAKIHYDAAMRLVKYLYDTKDDRIYYWRQHQNPTLPPMPIPTIKHDGNYNDYDIPTRQQHCPNILVGATDSDHAGDVSHRKSVSGVVLKLAGGAVLYKTSYQQTIAQSCTEAEFTAAVDAVKYILYLHTLLDEIGIPQHQATTLYEDNQGALIMAQAQKPTRQTRHMETKYFGLQDWVKRDLVTLERINTSDNYSDALTKAVGTTLFYPHMNFIMGKIVPEYALHKDTNLSFRRIYDMNLSFLIHRFTSREGDKEDMLVSM